jgi:hypothetical protein
MVHKTKWISTDEWHGYEQPVNAVAGSSDTGMWSDSPAPSVVVDKELNMLTEHLKSKGFKVSRAMTESSNAFMKKRWLVVTTNFTAAKKEADKWLVKHKSDTIYIHDAD